MATTTKTFTFDTTRESWVFVPSFPITKATDAFTAGNLASDSLGRNNNDNSYWEWTGTWEGLGVPPNSTITEVGSGTNNDYDYNVTNANVVDECGPGPFTIYDNVPSLVGTFSARITGITSNTAFTTVNGAAVSITGGLQPSNTTIRLRIGTSINLGNNTSARATVGLDNVSITITYTISAAPTAKTTTKVYII